MAAAVPVIAETAEAPATAHATSADASLEQTAPVVAYAATQGRPTAHWKWLVSLLLLLVVSQAGTIAWLALFDRASPPTEPAPHTAPARAPAPASLPVAPLPAPVVVRSLPNSEPMLVGSETVALRAGPSPDFPVVGELDAGTDVVASARSGGSDGASWIEVTAADGATGFVLDHMVQPKPTPALAVERAVPQKQTPAPEIERSVASTPTRKIKPSVGPTPARKIKRAAASTPARSRPKAVPAPARIACILPDGGEMQATRTDCRAQSGIIYQ